jgi:hypothetical protein
VRQVTPTSLVLHYYSKRQGLGTWVEGILDEIAKQIFGIQIRMERLRGRDTGDCDHEVRLEAHFDEAMGEMGLISV